MDAWTQIAYSAFGLSLLVSAVQVGRWALRADQRVAAEAGRWSLLALGGLAFATLMWLILKGRWTQAIMLGAFVTPVLLQSAPQLRSHLRLIAARRRSRRPARLGKSVGATADAELVRLSLEVLSRYLDQAKRIAEYRPGHARLDDGSGRASISAAEALAVLGLQPDAGPEQIRAAHCRLRQILDPALGGTRYLAAKIDEARDALLERQ